jgi:epoxyqueuosine reductase
MKHLLHTCCGPCLLFPLKVLQEKGHTVTGFFYNPNIHPYTEYKKRLSSLVQLSESENIPLIIGGDYSFDDYIRRVVFNEERRCSICYDLRLEATVLYAKQNGFSSFSTTLLYSKFQNHSLIKEKCSYLSEHYGILFVYDDFRLGWQEGVDLAIEKNLYRQPYCGCIYSEQERYDNTLKKRLQRQRKKEKRDLHG